MRIDFHILILIFCAAFAPSACRKDSAVGVTKETKQQREAVDDLGRKIELPEKIERVVSLAPNLTENVFGIGAGGKLVGVTSFCDYPAEANKITKIGDTVNPNLEAITAQKPQLVLVTTASQIESFTSRMEERGIPVFVTDRKRLADVLRNLRQFGELLGTEAQA